MRGATAAAADRRAQATARWVRCAACGTTLYVPRLSRLLGVCPDCGHHHRLRAAERIDHLLDPGSFTAASDRIRSADPLGFRDRLPYPERLAAAMESTGLDDAVVRGRGTVQGTEVVVAVMDFAFMGGSMGSAVGEAVTRAAEEALATRTPLLLVTASGGARMQEGCLSLMQMAKTAQAIRACSRAGVLTVSVLTDPTFGGVTASFATLTDVVLAEPRALVGFAGPRVIESATGRPLPDGFQTAEYLRDHGMVDLVEARANLRPVLGRVLALCAPRADDCGHRPPQRSDVRERDAWETVRFARAIDRPTTLDYIGMMCADFVELHGDRAHGDDPAIVGGPARLGGRNVMIIGHQKAHDTAGLVARNFGMPHPEGYRKAVRLMRLAERLGLPVVTLVDTQGAAAGVEAEERGQAWAIAESIATMAELTVPVVATVIGEGGSGGALALAVADRVLMLENACYSVISPESCSVILCGDSGRAAAMAEALRLTAPELLRLGVVDGVVPE
ncbi:MAG: acetyl-CoA carboxylase, carboxyltransferase subunit beta, partial [Actinomadura rubrobrunea]|nr:acetyl-CoA carboxylase, carboxyltransferase subunit beta [Actinomadura rubrobrunea]